MEKPVQSIQLDSAHDNPLRLVFSDGVISFALAIDATLEDVSRTLDEFAARHCGQALAIAVTLGVPQGELVRPASAQAEESHG
jgi:hypothetical protein